MSETTYEERREEMLESLGLERQDLLNDARYRLRVLQMLKDKMPSEFKRVKSVSMNNDCYYEITDFYLNGSDTLELSFIITATCNVIGSYSGSSSGANYSLYASTSNVSYLRYYNGTYNSMFEADKRYDVVITPTGTKGFKYNSTWDELEFTTSRPLCIGTTRSNLTTSAKMKGTFYGDITVTDKDGNDRFHGIPCIREEDGVVGYFDTVTEKFYEPVGTNPTTEDLTEEDIYDEYGIDKADILVEERFRLRVLEAFGKVGVVDMTNIDTDEDDSEEEDTDMDLITVIPEQTVTLTDRII